MIQSAKTVCRENRFSVFTTCCIFIALVGIWDTWLAIKYSDSILDMEKNPVCLYLMNLDPYGFMVFVYGKSAGIFLVICTLIALLKYYEKIAMHVTLAVTFFQFSLVCFLYLLSDIPHMIWINS